MTTLTTRRRTSQHGFSLLEMITVVAILTLVMGAVFKQIITIQQRYRAEETKLDVAQESREFLDQMVRDLHQAGYPTTKIYAAGAGLASPAVNDPRVAAGIVKYSYNDLWFEGDVDGDGQVDVVEYQLRPGPGGTCPCLIQRRQTTKNATGADLPLNRTGSSFATELQNVINSAGSGGTKTNGAYGISGTGPGGASNETLYGGLEGAYIFKAFKANGDPVTPPLDVSTTAGAKAIADIRSIQITVNVLGKPSGSDLQTGRRPAISLTATARITNY